MNNDREAKEEVGKSIFQSQGNVQHVLNDRGSLKFKEGFSVIQVIDRLKGTLQEAGHVSELLENSGFFDAILEYKTEGTRLVITVDVKTRAWPQEIEGIGLQARERTRSQFGTKSMPVIAAPSFSEDAKRKLRDAGVSWIDEAGNCELRSKGLYIRISGLSIVKKAGKYRLDPFGPQPSKALAVLIENPGTGWKLRDLANAAGVSLGTTSSLRNELRQRGYLDAQHGENRLLKVRQLLEEWADSYRPSRKEERYYTTEPFPKLERLLCAHGAALTEFSGAERLAPYARYQRIACYAPPDFVNHAKKLGLRRGDVATNVAIYVAPAPVGQTVEMSEIRVVSPVQIFLDLMALGGRGTDAAEHLRDEVILPPWEAIDTAHLPDV